MQENRKVRYTRRVIKEAFLQCLQEKPIGKITVAEVCEIADVHRGTFYQHYHDVYQLLETIENDLYAKLHEIQPMLENSMGSVASSAVIMIFGEQDTCRAILGKHGDVQFLKRILDLCRESSYGKYRKAGIPEEDHHYLYTYFTSGCIGVIRSWVESGFVESPEKIMEYITQLTQSGLEGFVEKSN